MGAVGGLLGTAGGASGSGYKTPQSAPIQVQTNNGQTNNAYNNVQNSLASQQGLLTALQGQNGLGAQSSALSSQQTLAGQLAANNGAANQQAALNAQTGLNTQLANANGVGTQQSAISGLQGVAGQHSGTESYYQDVANGQGPNPAQAMLNQSTGQNVANQAALMAGQRGAGANVGLEARQAAQQGAATQQQAVGQAATLQSQQQLNALSGLSAQQNSLANTESQIGNLGSTQVGQQQTGIGSQASIAGQQVAAQQAANAQVANQANQVAGQQIGQTNANTASQTGEQSALLGAQTATNQANVANQASINTGNTQLANTTLTGQQGLVGGVANAGGAALASPAAGARGGMVQPMAQGGQAVAPQSNTFSQFLAGWGSGMQQMGGDNPGAQALNKGFSKLGQGVVSQFNSPSQPNTGNPTADTSNYLGGNMSTGDYLGGSNPSNYVMQAQGGLAATGGGVRAQNPGERAVKVGNSYANDKVPALLSQGEIVVPRSVTQGKDPAGGAARFVAAVLAKKGRK